MPKKPDKLRDRLTEDYLVSFRNSAVESFNDWKTRTEGVDKMIRGEWSVTYPDGTTSQATPMVMNLMDTMPRDIARLVSEAAPSVHALATSDSDPDIKNALIREAVADTHWMKNEGPLMIPQFAMDLVITGAAFAVEWYDSASPYPHIMRVDPRFCYPDIHNGVMQDLLVVQRIKGRILQRLFPDIPVLDGHDPKKDDEFYEVWDYYSADECVKAISRMNMGGGEPGGTGSTWVVNRWHPDLECVPAAFAQLPAPDGGFRGMLDQLGTSLTTKNRAVQYLMDYMHHFIYAPWEAKGVLNASDEPGPATIYQHDPQANESFMRRVSPAPGAPQIMSLLQYIDAEQRGQAAYPATRQGDVSQSQASGSFVASTQGALTSVVRDIQRLIGSLREQATRATFEIDERYMDFDKPLWRPVVDKRTYTPSKAIKGRYDVGIVYGAGAGLDRQSSDVRLLQYYGNGAISAETMLENTDFVASPPDEIEKRQREELAKVILQRFAGDPSVSLDFIIQVFKIQRERGISLVDALVEAQAQQAPQPELQPPGAEIAGPEAAPSAEEQQLALEKGEVGGFEQAAPTFAPPPLAQVLVR